MSNEVMSTDRSAFSSVMERIKRPTALLASPLAMLALASCSSPSSPDSPYPDPFADTPEVTKTTGTTPSNKPSLPTQLEQGVGPCGLITFTSEATKECAEFQKHGRIALVYTNVISPRDAQVIADLTETHLKRATDSMITIQIDPIPSSPAATAEFKRVNKAEGCVDNKNPGKFLSTIADKKMPKLANHGMVVGISDTFSCDLASGTANSETYRHADIFNVLKSPDPEEASIIADVMAHEISHNFGLGHAGIVECLDRTKKYSQLHNTPSGEKTAFDLRKYMSDCQYTEYKTDSLSGVALPNLMSSEYEAGDEGVSLNPIQLQILREPNEDEKNRAHPLDSSPTILSAPDALQGNYITTNLGSSIALQDSGSTEHLFDSLQILPVVRNDKKSGPYVWAAEIYLTASRTNNAVSAGAVAIAGTAEKTWTVEVEPGKVVEVTLDGKTMKVKLN